jgi:lipopolysaccharide biosynthesis protein/GT2 family glycosyltransferase/tetratricopeptide (TPR) repeat protein
MALDRIVGLPRLGFMRRKPSVITLADRARDAGQWELAARLYRKALDRDPHNPPIWVQYGHALKESGELRKPDRLAQAEVAYRRALSLDPGAADTYLQLGHVLKLQGKIEEAQAAYLRAVALDPSMPYPLQELSGLGWSEAQMAELRGLVGPNLPPASSPVLEATSRDIARRDLEELPDIVDLPRLGFMRRKPSVITRADRAQDAGQWELAARLYRKALDRNPHNPPIWVQYGHALKESGELREPDRLAQAEVAYRRALSLDPGAADTYLQLGHVLKLQGKTEEAQAAYLRAAALDPSMPYPLQELSGLGWSEAHFSELRGMLGTAMADPLAPASVNGHEKPTGRQDDLTNHRSPENHPPIMVEGSGRQGDGNEIGHDRPNGPAELPQQVVQPANPADCPQDYANWVRLYDTINDDDREAIASALNEMADRPLISVVMPVYNTEETYLRAAIGSVRRQLYPIWELCIADDASTAPHVRRVLEYYRAVDPRIKVCYRSENGHISAASNSALALAKGSFVALLDHDDALPEHALYVVAATLNADPDLDLVYSDEDKIDANGRRYDAYFKSDWNPDLLLSQNMFCHLGVYRRSILEHIGGFRCGYEGSQDYDLVLRAQRMTTPSRIRHIPHVLYHWRAIPGSEALGTGAKPYALENARRAITDHLAESGIAAAVSSSPHSAFHRVRYALPEGAPRVTIVIPTRDRADLLRTCIEGLLHRTDYPDIEILIVDNQSREAATRTYLDQLTADPRIRILSYDAPYNYAAINNFAIARATGSILCLLNNDTDVITRDWLTEMVSQAVRPGIGAVGALLYYTDDRIQHAGVVFGPGGVAWLAHLGLRRGDFGYFGRAVLVQNFSAVTAACIVMTKKVFDEVGGFNEKDLAIAYNDVDLCLRLREAGYRIVWTPHAELYHYGSASRGADTDPDKADRLKAEAHYMLRRWVHILDHDPYYNPNLRLDGSFELSFPPRIDKPWRRGRLALTALSNDNRLILESGLFDPAWYPAQNLDVVMAGIEPLTHYLATGSAEGRRPNPLFDPAWYRAQNPDVMTAGIEPLTHYLATGSAEGRRPNPLFDPAWYRAQNPDVVAAGLEPLAHYLATGAAERRASSPEGPAVRFSIPVPDVSKLRKIKPRSHIAVVLHLFDPDLWGEMREAIERILHRFDLFVSLVKGSSEHMRPLITEAFPYAYVFDFEDHGRDIGSFLVFVQSGVLFQYELVCKLHTKRSPHLKDHRCYENGDEWRRALIDGVLGSSGLINRVVSCFRSDSDLGMVVADGNIYRGHEHWAGNEKLLAQLLPRIGISPEVKDRSFPGGSIFWIRSFLLRTLVGAGVYLEDFDPEPLKLDGGLGHAVERMFGLICEDAGMRVVEHGQLAQPAQQCPRGSSKVHLIPFYLPQFHPIPENDEWWGTGFTEWTNVTRARPLFRGHRQPRLPSDLGYYDLRLPEAREAQAKLARKFGLAAFCYYYYWFDGRRVLERPLSEVLASGKPDFPFMIFWANEPWTRNWDGENSDVLLPQSYEPGWATRFARDVAPLLRDQRYFRLNGTPMLLIYRIAHIPNAAAAIHELRTALLYGGIPKVHLAAAWVYFRDDGELPADPGVFGLDAYFEFPPHMGAAQSVQPLPPELHKGFQGCLFDYNRTVTAALARLKEPVAGRRHRSVMAGFDNTARKPASAYIYYGATPTNFRRWLRGTILHERHHNGERVVFINAWNEWAEGTYLEPDREFGRGWLEALASAADVEWPATQAAGAGEEYAQAAERWLASARRATESPL